MLITRISIVSGKTRTRDIPIKEEDYKSWQDGTVIQQAAPYLSKDDREFILTGITQQEWEDTFKEQD